MIVLSMNFNVFRLISRAKGIATSRSDGDIGVTRSSAPLTTRELLSLRELFDETPYRVDIVDFTDRNDRFAQLAMREMLAI
jgi:hypothetical protein